MIATYLNKVAKYKNTIASLASYVPIPSNYVAYWKFNGDYTDETGNYNGAKVGTGGPNFVAGKIGQCVELNINETINTQYINTGLSSDSFFNETKPYTISFWFKTLHSSRDFFCTFNAGAAPFFCNHEASPNYYLTFGRVSSGGVDGVLVPGLVYLDNEWHHFLGRYDSQTVDFWLDGVFKGSKASTLSTNENDDSLTIGRHGDYNGYYYHGYLDNFRIYDYAITDEQILSLSIED